MESAWLLFALLQTFYTVVYGTKFTVRQNNKPFKLLQSILKQTARSERLFVKL